MWAVTLPGHWMLAEMAGKSEVETKLRVSTPALSLGSVTSLSFMK